MIITLNQQIEDINYEISGAGAMEFNFDGIETTPDDQRLHRRRIALYDKQNELIKEIEKYEAYFEELSNEFNQLSKEMQEIIFGIYVLEGSLEYYADRYHVSKRKLQYDIDASIIPVLSELCHRNVEKKCYH